MLHGGNYLKPCVTAMAEAKVQQTHTWKNPKLLIYKAVILSFGSAYIYHRGQDLIMALKADGDGAESGGRAGGFEGNVSFWQTMWSDGSAINT